MAGKEYEVTFDFVAEEEGELTCRTGQRVRALEPEDPENPGWLFVQLESGGSGFVPIDFLKESAASKPKPKRRAPMAQAAAPPPAIGADDDLPPPALGGDDDLPPPALDPFNFDDVPVALGDNSGAASSAVPSSSPFDDFDFGTLATPSPLAEDADFGQKLNYWKSRDARYGSGALPQPQQRRWYYRDIFNDMQGPFNPAEMKQRLDAKHIGPTTKILIETGSGSASCFEEKTLRELYPSPEAAFMQAPVVQGATELCWYYQDDQSREQGPFSSEQMKLWLDDGYFCESTMMRSGDGKTRFEALGELFPDPHTAFVSEPQFATGKPSGPSTVVGGALAATSSGGAVTASPDELNQLFTSNSGGGGGGGLNSTQSGKALLLSAYDTNEAPPVAIGAPAPVVVSATPVTDDNTEKDAPTAPLPPPSAAQASKALAKAKDRASPDDPVDGAMVYGKGWEGLWTGVPSPKKAGKSYPTDLYTFLTRPIPPEAGVIQMYIRRDIDGTHFNFNVYECFLEKGSIPILAGFRHRHVSMSNYYDIKMNTTGKAKDPHLGLTIARVDLNYMGTEFLLHNDVKGHQGKPRDLACVLYEKNRLKNKGPRKMRVGIPGIESSSKGRPEFHDLRHTNIKSSAMITSLKSLNVTHLIAFLNKPPQWNKKHQAYMLDFKGRVTRASVKNFQLVDALHDKQHTHVALQHGRVGANKFTVDVQHPMCPLQAFAIALTSLHSKKGVD